MHLERNNELSKQRGEQAGGMARECSHRVHEQIMLDKNGVHHFARASQNMATAAMILRSIPELQDPKGLRIHLELKGLLEIAAVQQAESSLQWRQEANSNHQT